MSSNKKICLSLLNRNFKNATDMSSILLVGNIGESLEKIASELMYEADLHCKVIKLHTSNKLPIPGISTLVCRLGCLF